MSSCSKNSNNDLIIDLIKKLESVGLIHASEFDGTDKEKQTILIEGLVRGLASKDPLVRDDVIYGAICDIASENPANFSSEDLLRELIKNLEGERFSAIDWATPPNLLTDQTVSDILGRSFRTLALTPLLHFDLERKEFSKDLIERSHELTNKFLREEHCPWGYVAGYGWFHNIAHIFDLAALLVEHPHTSLVQARNLIDSGLQALQKQRLLNDENEHAAFMFKSFGHRFNDVYTELLKNDLNLILDNTDNHSPYAYNLSDTLKSLLLLDKDNKDTYLELLLNKTTIGEYID